MPARLGKRLEPLDFRPVALAEVLVGPPLGLREATVRRHVVARVLAAQESTCKREEWQEAESVMLHGRRELRLDHVADDEAVLILARDERCRILRPRDLLRF